MCIRDRSQRPAPGTISFVEVPAQETPRQEETSVGVEPEVVDTQTQAPAPTPTQAPTPEQATPAPAPAIDLPNLDSLLGGGR